MLFILSFYWAVVRLSNAIRIPIEDANPLQRPSQSQHSILTSDVRPIRGAVSSDS